MLLKKHSASGSSFLLSSKDQESLNLLDATIRCLNFCCATFELLLRHQEYTESQPSNSSLAAARKICRVVSSASCGCKQSTHRHTPSLAKSSLFKNLVHFSICACHPCAGANANLLCIVPILSDDPRRESGKWCISYVHVVPAHATILHISKMTTTPFIFLATATPYRSCKTKAQTQSSSTQATPITLITPRVPVKNVPRIGGNPMACAEDTC